MTRESPQPRNGNCRQHHAPPLDDEHHPPLPRGARYDPWEHADLLGLQVLHRPLSSAHGLWLPEYHTVVIDSGLRVTDQRVVLAHELGHAVLGHEDDRPRFERHADVFAARRLICPDELARAYGWCGGVGELLDELGVTRRIFVAYVDGQPPW